MPLTHDTAPQRTPAAAPPGASAVAPVQGAVLALQAAAGNRAVSRLVQRSRRQPPPVATVQRDVENETFGADVSDEDEAKAKLFFAAFDAAVKKAYEYVISVPSLDAYVTLDGHTVLWGEKWAEFVAGGRPKLMAATFGYVIESLVSHDDGPFRPAPPSGCSVYPQVTVGGTRPDLVLRLKKGGGGDIAWLDLTASASADHIFSKEGWHSKVGSFAEVTYPSLDPGSLAFMVANKDNKGPLSADEFKKRQEVARALYAKRKAAWVAMGQAKYSSRGSAPDFNAYLRMKGISLKGRRMVLDANPEIKRTYMRNRLGRDFGAVVEDKMVPSILQALGVGPATWGFTTGYSVSERAGEAWLVDNDPTIVPDEPVVEEAVALVPAEAPDKRSPGGGKMPRNKVRAKSPYDRV